MDLSFLKSTRFWKLVAIGILEALVAVGVIDGSQSEAVVRILEAVLGASVVIRTTDRFAEQVGFSKLSK